MKKNWKAIKLFVISCAIAFLCLLAHTPHIAAQNSPSPQTTPQLLKTPQNQKKPVEVSVGIYITNFANIDQTNETFDLVGYLLATWKDERLAFNPKEAGEDTKSYSLQEIWHPLIEMVNAKDFSNKNNTDITVQPDGTVYYQENFKVTLSSTLDFKKFPLDSQQLQVLIESFKYDANQVIFVPDKRRIGISKDSYVSLAEWQLQGLQTQISRKLFEPDNTEYSRLTFIVEVKRNYGFYIWKVFIPLFLLTVISWSVFWIDTQEFGTQVSVGITSLLSVIAFSFTVNDTLPRVAYITLIDGFIFLCYMFVFLSIVELVVVHFLSRTNKLEFGLSIQNKSRWFFPLMYGICNIIFIASLMIF